MAHREPNGDGLTGYAFVKYGIILVIVIVILFFIVRYLFPLFTDREQEEEPELPEPPEQTLVLELPAGSWRLVA